MIVLRTIQIVSPFKQSHQAETFNAVTFTNRARAAAAVYRLKVHNLNASFCRLKSLPRRWRIHLPELCSNKCPLFCPLDYFQTSPCPPVLVPTVHIATPWCRSDKIVGKLGTSWLKKIPPCWSLDWPAMGVLVRSLYRGKNRKPVFSAIKSEKNSGVINTKRSYFSYLYISVNAAQSSYHKVSMAVWIYETMFCQELKVVFSTPELLETLLKRRHQVVHIQVV